MNDNLPTEQHLSIPSYFRGALHDLNALTPGEVFAEHAASCLAKINRYNGNTPVPYSVAQHTILVGELCYRHALSAGGTMFDADRARYEGLHHDTTEAYIGDIIGPLKALLWMNLGSLTDPDWFAVREYEARVRRDAVAPALGLDYSEPEYIHPMDMLARRLEQRYLQGREDVDVPADVYGMKEATIRRFLRPMYWKAAERAWLDAHLAFMPEATP